MHGVNRCGRICPGDFAQKHRANYKRAGLTEWKQDVMRHTFASNHLAHFGNLDALLQAMGYRSSPQTLWRYYHKARTKSIDEVITRILGGQNAVNTIRTSIRGNYCSDRTITPFVTRKPVKTQDADPLESTQAPFFKL